MASDKVKGSIHRIITTPGYHIKPQYDLAHTRQILNERRNKKRGFQLMLAPMVDMFSILVIYLIMNFSTENEAYFAPAGLKIPKSSTGQVMHTNPLVSVVGQNIKFSTADNTGVVSEINDEKVPQLRTALRRIKSMEFAIAGEQQFKGEVNLQADENSSVEEVKKVMRVLIEEGWTGINFVVDPAK